MGRIVTHSLTDVTLPAPAAVWNRDNVNTRMPKSEKPMQRWSNILMASIARTNTHNLADGSVLSSRVEYIHRGGFQAGASALPWLKPGASTSLN